MDKKGRTSPTKSIVITLAGIVFIIIVWLLITNGGNKSEKSCATNAERRDYLASFGWECAENPTEVVEITIPGEFNEVYRKYNDIQRLQGFDLRKYRGKGAVKYTYEVLNYPNGDNTFHRNVIADIIVLDGRIIGGDICSPELGGFMHGFEKE